MFLKKLFPLGLLLLITSAIPPLQHPYDKFAELHPRIKELFIKKDYQASLNLLQILKSTDSNLYNLNNYPFLEAVALINTGKSGESIKILQAILQTDTVLKDHALYQLACITRETDSKRGQELFKKLINDYNYSIYKPDALLAIAEIYMKGSDYVSARRYYSLWGKASRALSIEAQYKQAYTYALEQNYTKAADLYFLLLKRNRRNDIALASLERLENLERIIGKIFFKSYDSYYQRAMTAFTNRHYDIAEKYFKKLLTSSKNNKYRQQAYYYLARSYERAEKYEEAIKYFAEFIRIYPNGNWGCMSLYQKARCHLLSNQKELAIKDLNLLIKKFGKRKQVLSAYFLLFQQSLRDNKTEEALKLAYKIMRLFPGSIISYKVQIETSVIKSNRGNYNEALDLLNSLLKKRIPSGYKPEIIYWKAKIYEKLGDLKNSEEMLLEIIQKYPNDFFRFLAQDRLKIYYAGRKEKFYQDLYEKGKDLLSIGSINEAKKLFTLIHNISPYTVIKEEAAAKLKYLLSSNKQFHDLLILKPYEERPVLLSKLEKGAYNPHLLRSSELAFLGLYDLAAEEFKIYRSNDYRDVEKLLTLSQYYLKGKNINRAIFWGESLINLIGQNIDYLLLPKNVKEVLYPVHFEYIVNDFSKHRGINKFFVFALIREESKFKTDAKSPAAARGLMQFIPSTARDIAAELGLEDFEIDELYSPDLSINLGTQYLANLMKNYKNNYIHVLSAYNSGKNNTDRWKSRCSGEEPEEFIARIEFTETRNYVKRVMATFRTYLSINSYDISQK